MGSGIEYKCSKCGKEYEVCCGVGFLFPQVYEGLMNDIKSGKYGQGWKKLALSEDTIAIDAVSYVYVCKKCGFWAVEPGLSLYVANDSKAVKEYLQSRHWTAGHDGTFVTFSELRQDYHILKRRVHKCAKCKGIMHKATEYEEYNLKCPYCGNVPDKNTIRGEFRWD